MSDEARKHIIRTAGVIIILLALGAALLPMEHGLSGRLVVGLLLVAAVLFARRGLLGLFEDIGRYISKKRTS